MSSVERITGYVVYRNDTAIFVAETRKALQDYLLEQSESDIAICHFNPDGSAAWIKPHDLKHK